MLSRKANPTRFTQVFTADSSVPTIEAAENAGDNLLHTARQVDGTFTYLKPQTRPAELKWISPRAFKDAIPIENSVDDAMGDREFHEVMAGQRTLIDKSRGIYPFATNYGGHQFGNWAGQLGDGRAITLFKLGKYLVQLKGAGRTPYSRFADGLAVLRSSIREALASEYLNALGIPTQRVLTLSVLPHTFARRERIEQCAVVGRMAESYVRIGTFELLFDRGKKEELRKLADYCIDLFKEFPVSGLMKSSDKEEAENRYYHFFREVSLRNAIMLAKCQAYGFLNGVLNTDNISVMGLSIDYGPFSFVDNFNPDYSPNHSDPYNRYGFRNVPMSLWWACVKLAESLWELIGAGSKVDSEDFIHNGIREKNFEEIYEVVDSLIQKVGKQFRYTYELEFHRTLMARIGLSENGDYRDLELVASMLKMLQLCEIDYNTFFRKLCYENKRVEEFMPEARKNTKMSDAEVYEMISNWLEDYRLRLKCDRCGVTEEQRRNEMLAVNPKFYLRNSVLSTVIKHAQENNWEYFKVAAEMALHPFQEEWKGLDSKIVEQFIEIPKLENRNFQLSCSS